MIPSSRTHSIRPKRSGMSTFSFILGSVLWIVVLVTSWALVVKKGQDEGAETPVGDKAEPAAATGESATDDQADSGDTDGVPKSVVIRFPARELPEFEFPECMGGTVSRESMRGKRWLASFVFTRCVATCPTITRSVSELHERVKTENPDFQFVTFSVDSSYDTAEVLKKYGETFRADHKRWKFVTGDENQIHDLIRLGFAQIVKPNLGEMRKPGFEVAHSNYAVLVNEDAVPVARYLMTEPADVVRLRRVIEGKTEFPEPGPGLSITAGDGSSSDDGTPPVQLNLVPVLDDSAATDDSGGQDAKADDRSPEPSSSGGTDTSKAGEAAGAPANAAPQLDQPQTGSAADDETDPENSGTAAESAEKKNEAIEQNLPVWVKRLPGINAALNSCCTVLLIAGFIAIRTGQRTIHRNLMITAFVTSVVFLGCYVTYHEALHRYTGERGRAFIGSDTATLVYRCILVPHVFLAVFVPILAIRVFVHAWRERWSEHRWLARITLPIWLFVSITGVVIYWMLYHWPWRNVSVTAAITG